MLIADKNRHHAVDRQLLTFLQNARIDDAVAGLVQQFDTGFHRISLSQGVWGELHHIAILNNHRVIDGHSHGMAGFGVLHKHPVLPMNGNKKLGLGESQHQLLIFLEAMAGHMDTLSLAVNNLGAKHHQLVDRVHHGNGVPRDRTGGENNRVCGFHLHLRVITARDAA